MPFTPYHFGPSGFIGLLFRRRLDVPVFVAANVLIDIEVLADQYFQPGWPVHQLWHFHTLLVGGLAGAILGLLVYRLRPLRFLSEKSMSLIGLPGCASWHSMVLAGVLGAWLHVFIDSLYHYDVQLFWPYPFNAVGQWIGHLTKLNLDQLQPYVRLCCVVFYVLLFALYAAILIGRLKNKRKP